MNPVLLAIIGLRSAALAASLAGRPNQAAALYAGADLLASGKAVDEHMQVIADKLAQGSATDADWVDVRARIESDAARLHSS